MTALPAKNVLDGSTAPLTSAMKTAMGQLRDFLSETVGAVGGALTIANTAVTSPVAGDGNVFSGTYTPTLTTTILNVAAGTSYECQYMRVGDVVTVSGRIDIDPIAVGRITFGLSLPIPSSISATAHCGGTFFAGGATTLNVGAVNGDGVNDRANFDGVAQDIASRVYSFIFSYKVI